MRRPSPPAASACTSRWPVRWKIYASRLEEHAVELAEHFSYSSDAADLKKAVCYGEMAARRATDVYAYGEAVRLLEQALKVQESP